MKVDLLKNLRRKSYYLDRLSIVLDRVFLIHSKYRCGVSLEQCKKRIPPKPAPEVSFTSPEGCKIFNNVDYNGGMKIFDIDGTSYSDVYSHITRWS